MQSDDLGEDGVAARARARGRRGRSAPNDLPPLPAETRDEGADEDEDEDEDEDGGTLNDLADTGEESVADDAVLDLAPDIAETAPALPGYRTSTSLPTCNLPHVLVFEDGRWQRGTIAFAADETLTVRTARARSGTRRRLDQNSPAQIAQPHARGSRSDRAGPSVR